MLISLTADHQKNILEVLSIHDLVLVLFEKGVEVIKLVILLHRKLLLQETHLVHKESHSSNIKVFLHWLDVITWPIA